MGTNRALGSPAALRGALAAPYHRSAAYYPKPTRSLPLPVAEVATPPACLLSFSALLCLSVCFFKFIRHIFFYINIVCPTHTPRAQVLYTKKGDCKDRDTGSAHRSQSNPINYWGDL